MTRITRSLLFTALAVCATPALVLGTGKPLYLGPHHDWDVRCLVHVNQVTHKYTKDGRATYAMPGLCSSATPTASGVYQGVRYHVDAVWNPAEETAAETGRIYDLGSIWDMFQRGGATIFVNRYQCKGGDPWLSDARCGLLGSTAGEELKRMIPRLTQTPYPLTKDAIPVSRRAALKAEYDSLTKTGILAKPSTSLKTGVLIAKPAPGSPPPPPPPPPPPKPSAPYGAKYTPGTLQAMNRGQTRSLAVQVTNTGGLTWTPANPNPFRLSYHWFRGAQEVVRDGLRTNLAGPVAVNQGVTLNAKLRAPSSPGTYTLKWDMVQEGVTWFRNKGVATADQTVVVK